MNYFEIFLLIIPSLIIFLTIYLLMRQFFKNEMRLRMMKHNEETRDTLTPLKIQACERLTLFCERVSIPNLLLRIKNKNLSAGTLKSMLILAVQQEYEHNVSQQLYVSDKLWKIIQLAKNQIVEIIALVGEKVGSDEDGETYANELIAFLEQQEKDPLMTAKMAIKREAGILY